MNLRLNMGSNGYRINCLVGKESSTFSPRKYNCGVHHRPLRLKVVSSSVRVLNEVEHHQLEPPPRPQSPLSPLLETWELVTKGPLHYGVRRMKSMGPIFASEVAGLDAVMICDTELGRALLLEDGKLLEAMFKDSFEKVLGWDAMNQDLRSRDRQSFMKAFSSDALTSYIPVSVDLFKDRWDKEAQHPDFLLKSMCRLTAADHAFKNLMGFELESDAEKIELADGVNDISLGVFAPAWDFPGSPLNQGIAARKLVHERLSVHIDKAIDAMASYQDRAGSDTSTVRKTLLHGFLDAYGAESKQNILHAATSVLQAGLDTTGAGLEILLVVLSMMPEASDKIYKEQVDIVTKRGGEINRASLEDMVYLDAFVRELVRVQPLLMLQLRRASVDFKLGGFLVRKGTPLMFNYAVMHESELAAREGRPLNDIPAILSEDTLRAELRPERWLGDGPRPTLMAFGFGPHSCAGIALFFQTMKIAVATLLRRYTFERTSGAVKWNVHYITCPMPEGNVRMRLQPRPEGEQLLV